MSSRSFYCTDCGCSEGFRSRPRTFTERFLLPLFLMRPVRCGDCFRRSYQMITVPVKERKESVLPHHIAA
jgi:hypothetical protein